MSNPQVDQEDQEPTMEEILSSIKKIISDDDQEGVSDDSIKQSKSKKKEPDTKKSKSAAETVRKITAKIDTKTKKKVYKKEKDENDDYTRRVSPFEPIYSAAYIQDKFAFDSQTKALKAQKESKFNDEIIPFTIELKKGSTIFKKDEHPREGISMEALQRLKTAFQRDGTVTAGNASGINDGAAAIVLMSKEEAEKEELNL